MKYIVVIMFFTVLFNKTNSNESQKIMNAPKLVNMCYRVYQIDSLNLYYLVYLENNTNKYKVVSKKTFKKSCNPIQINHSYNFKIESVLEKGAVIGSDTLSVNSGLINCLFFKKDTMICKEEDKGIYDLYRTNDLDGLCVN